MNDQLEDMDAGFFQLVLSLQAGIMQQLGKVVSPISGKVERDLPMAKATIDILEMLENKTKGNLSEEESKFLGHVLYEIRMNYMDEMKKGDSPAPETAPDSEEKKADNKE